MSSNDDYWNHQLPSMSELSAQRQAESQAPSPSAQPVAQADPGFVEAPAAEIQQQVPAEPEVPAAAPISEVEAPAAAAECHVEADTVAQAATGRAQASAEPLPSNPTPAPYASSVQYRAVGPQEKKNGHGWIVAIVAIVCLFALMAFSVKACSDSMNSLSYFGSAGGSSIDDLSGDAVAVLELDGTIQYDGTVCSPEGFKEMLDEAAGNDYVKALVIRVNSGGGTATAGEEMTEYLRQFEKPVVVSSASINASAAYEISSQADYIYVAKSTEIGSIGTAMEVTDLSGLFEKLGIKMETITSSDSKDSTYGYRTLTDDEREYYQNMINQINELFIENVAEGRKMDVAEVRKLATGLVFTGVDAVENGLADAVGTREDAISKAAELAGITDYTTVDLTMDSYDFSEFAYLLGENQLSDEELVDLLASRLGSTGKTGMAH